jgi:tRNA/rRNA methyltransferase
MHPAMTARRESPAGKQLDRANIVPHYPPGASLIYGVTMNAPKPCVILNEPQLAENIGAVARVMANFGLSDLRMVRPRDGWPQPRAWASASGADWPLEGARVFATLAEAIADLHLVLATTARPRETALPILTPREAAASLAQAVGGGQVCGLLFGGERAGLETADIALCRAIVTIPIDPAFRSLNLAQAVAITAYEWRLTKDAGPPPRFADAAGPGPADQASLHGFYDQLEGELDAAGFFHPPEKRASMVRNLRVAFGRAALTDQEVRTLRGVVTALSRGRGRVLAKLAAAKARAGVADAAPSAGDD